MRYPTFAAALRKYGKVQQVQALLGVKSRSQTIAYMCGRTLPRAEKILPFPDLIEAARFDVMANREPELAAA